MPGTPEHLEAVDRAIEAEADAAFAFLERLVRARSTVGDEAGAQDVVAGELARLGFAASRVPVPERTAAHPAAGVPQCSYAGRENVLGRLNPGASPSLLFNGHVDVVPAEAEVWSGDPFEPVTVGDWASSVPARARVGVRVGYPRRWTANEAFDQVRAAVQRAAAADPWLAGHPPVLRQTGFRAQGYLLRHDHPLVTAVADAHASAHGDRPAHRVLGSTTDARYQEAAQCVGLQAGSEAPPPACHVDWASSIRQDCRVRYRRAGGNVPARGKSLWSGCKTRSFASWRSAWKQEAAEVPRARHRLNPQPSGRGARQYLNQFGRPTLAYGPRARRTRLRQRARP